MSRKPAYAAVFMVLIAVLLVAAWVLFPFYSVHWSEDGHLKFTPPWEKNQ